MQFNKITEPTNSINDKVLKIFKKNLPILNHKEIIDFKILWDHCQCKIYNLHLEVTNSADEYSTYYIFTVNFQNGIEKTMQMIDYKFLHPDFSFNNLNNQIKKDFIADQDIFSKTESQETSQGGQR